MDDATRARHFDRLGSCWACKTAWPCDAAAALADYDAQAARLAALAPFEDAARLYQAAGQTPSLRYAAWQALHNAALDWRPDDE